MKRTTDERTRAVAIGRMAYTQDSPGCLYLTTEEAKAFVAVLSESQLYAMLRCSDGIVRAAASWRYYPDPATRRTCEHLRGYFA